MPEHAADAVRLPSNASETLRIMGEAAALAAKGLLDASQNQAGLQVTEKTGGDFVSEADHEAERTIAKCLDRAFPGYGWLGEESGERQSEVDGLRWIVDPLDGTTNFLKGLPHWAISIALYRGDAPLCAIVHDPIKRETFSAERNQGAFLNGDLIRVSEDAAMTAALLATGVPSGGRVTHLPHCLRDLAALMPETAGIRRWGAAALDLAYVAAGRLDAYWERNLGTWDIAAGLLIVEEAGGQVLPLWPDQGMLNSGSFIAGNRGLVQSVIQSLDRAAS